MKPAILEQFTRNLSTQLEAGVPLLRALEVQASDEDALDNGIIEEIANSLRGGSSFSEALEGHPRAFPLVYRRLVESSEISGSLPSALLDLADFLQWRERVKSLLRKASIYPATVLTACVLLIAFVLGFVFPKFAPLFEKLGDDLPVMAAVLLQIGDFLATRWLSVLGGTVAAAVAGFAFLRSPFGAAVANGFLTRLPVVGSTLWAIDLARFSRNLSVTSRAGVDVVQGLELSLHAVGNSYLRQGLERIHRRILGGESLTLAMGQSELFEPMFMNMIAVGEEAGRIPEVLERLADASDRRARESVERMLAIMEPAVTVFLGLVVGGMAVTIIGTLYKAMAVAGA